MTIIEKEPNMPKPVVLLYESIHEKAVEFLEQHAEVRLAASLNEDDLASSVQDVEGIIIRANGKVTRRIMEAAPHLKVVARHGVGIEAIDRQAAAELGIRVVNTPDANVESVAEHCVGMMVILAKRILQADQALRGGDWNSRYRLIGEELFGRTLGVIGFGRIGQRVAEICSLGFCMQIIYSDVVASPEFEQRIGARQLPTAEVLSQADFVSLHVPLIPDTSRMIGVDALKKMRSSAFLINSSRGAVVDPEALLQALREGWIAGAGLDVYDLEPLPAGDPLLALPNVVLTPHMAAHSGEALLRMAMVVEDVIAVIEGREPKHPVPLHD